MSTKHPPCRHQTYARSLVTALNWANIPPDTWFDPSHLQKSTTTQACPNDVDLNGERQRLHNPNDPKRRRPNTAKRPNIAAPASRRRSARLAAHHTTQPSTCTTPLSTSLKRPYLDNVPATSKRPHTH